MPGITLHLGDCLDVMRGMEPDSVDSIVTDPPYGLEFMGKDWDHGVPGVAFWKAALRVAKPGAILLAFGGTRTHHRLMCAIEDAGWEIRDCVMWLYGCLSDDTEILTSDGWKTYDTIFDGSMVMCYNVGDDKLEWGQVQGVYTYAISDTAYRIQSDSTDQIVTREHRCLVERGGEYTFQRAATLERQETVPILEGVPDMRFPVPGSHQRASNKEQVLRDGVPTDSNWTGQQGGIPRQAQTNNADLPSLRQGILATQSSCRESKEPHLQLSMQRSFTGQGMEETCPQGPRSLEARERGCACGADDGRHESRVEGWRHLLAQAWQLSIHQVRALSRRVLGHGSQGRLCYGTPSSCSSTSWAMPQAVRGSTPYRPRPNEQRPVQSDAICQQQPTQETRGHGATRPTLATVTPVHYNGIVWCVSVPTGAFVARRNGHVFVTGNSGFPKSHDISKAIDKAAGAEREVVGQVLTSHDGIARKPNPEMKKNWGKNSGSEYNGWGTPITAPATPAAQLWDGWGSALKPAYEPIILAMKPRDGTFANNALVHGVAGLNVDGCRVGTDGRPKREVHPLRDDVDYSPNSLEGRVDGSLQSSRAIGTTTQGRWPANLLLSHTDRCVKAGTRRVKPRGGSGIASGKSWQNKSAFKSGGVDFEGAGHTDPDGMETIDAWECVPECPVRLLGEDSGERNNGAFPKQHGASMFVQPEERARRINMNDHGTAARFFTQLEPDLRFKYCAKASRKERNAGLEGMEESSGGTYASGKGRKAQRINGGDEWEYVDESPAPRANHHPTVKPLAVMRWLCKLSKTPTGGVVLDPFMGSGTTGMAAALEGRDFVGIEIDSEYMEIAKRRIEWARGQVAEPHQLELEPCPA